MASKRAHTENDQRGADHHSRPWDELDDRLQEDIDAIAFSMDAEAEELEKISVKPKSTDITLEIFGLAWMPFRKNAGGGLSPDWG